MGSIQEESRKQFEHEIKSRGMSAMKRDGRYVESATRFAFDFWQASRANIAVDTPQLCGDGENDTEYTEGYNDGITATEKTIISIGISIKGEE